MIVLLDLCYRENSLSLEEFVLPVERLVRSGGYTTRIVHHNRIDRSDLTDAEAVILCGTALADRAWRESPEIFSWIPGSTVPVLGIGAGMEAMILAEGGSLKPCREIGMIDVHVRSDHPLCRGEDHLRAYALHHDGPVPPPQYDIIAESEQCPQIVSHRTMPRFGTLFQPEVRNGWLIHRFLDLIQFII
ncbi:MAG: glutamine amidotransferase-related protein [Methanoculleaceae archaeon]